MTTTTHISPYSEAGDGPSAAEADRVRERMAARHREVRAQETADAEAARLAFEMTADRKARRAAGNDKEREAYQRNLGLALYHLAEALKVEPAMEHAIASVMNEIVNVYVV